MVAMPGCAGVTDAQVVVNEQSFVRTWLVLGPYRNERPDLTGSEYRRKGIADRKDCFGYDHDLLAGVGGERNVRPEAGQKVPHTPSVFGDSALRWRVAEASDWFLDLTVAVPTGADPLANLVAYACANILSSQDRKISLKVSSDDAVKLWLNGELIHDHFVRRGVAKGGADEVTAKLKQGSNVLLAKVDQSIGGWALAVQLLAPDGTPVVAAGWPEFMPPQIARATAEIRERLPQAKARLAALQQRAVAADLTANVYVDCGLYIAERYLKRVQSERDTPQWKVQQLDEIGYVLTETEALIRDITGGEAPPLAVPRPTGGPVTIKDGCFLTEVSVPGGEPYVSPYYFCGYGHWSQAARDIPNFWRLGVTLIQQTKAPTWAMSRDGTYIGGSLTGPQKCALDSAQQHRMKVDILIELHSFPEWAFEANPEMRLKKGGFIKFNIDHPVARQVCKQFVEGLLTNIKDKPSLFSVCLSNEPSYRASGRDKYSRPLYPAFLGKRHSTIEQLNELYRTEYADFDEVHVPDMKPDDVAGRRALYDWATFNRKHFLDWHEWLNGLVKGVAPNVMTHTKTLWLVLNPDDVTQGYDPERMSGITDIAGLDPAAYYYGGEQAPTTGRFYSSEDAFGWSVQTMGNDFHHSIKGAPVFNSEHHIIPSRITRAFPVPPQHTRAALWQGALHHMGACTIWVWHEAPPTHIGLQGSIYFRPGNIYAASRTMFDLNRLAEQVSAVSSRKPRVALLYSLASVHWDEGFLTDFMDTYVALTFMGEPVGFVTERQLAAGTFKDYDWIIVPNVPAVRESTVSGLREYMKRGAKVILYGDKCLTKDEYWRSLPAGPALDKAVSVAHQESARLLMAQLDEVFAGGGLSRRAAMIDARTGEPAWGVDYRVVSRDGLPTLVSALNVLNKPVELALDIPGQAIDLITGAPRELKNFKLDPMEFVLLEVTAEQ